MTEMAGTDVNYKVKVKDIRTRVLPALDDEFAKDVGDFATLDALRERVTGDLQREADSEADRQLRARPAEGAGGARHGGHSGRAGGARAGPAHPRNSRAG